MEYRFRHGEDVYSVRRDAGEAFVVPQGEDEPATVPVRRDGDRAYRAGDEQRAETAWALRDGDTVWVHFRGRTWRLERETTGARKRGGAGPGGMVSPMPGQVQKHLVAEGDRVEKGQPLLVVEAMKMQLEIKASHGGTVTRILAAEGSQVDAGVPLVELAGEDA